MRFKVIVSSIAVIALLSLNGCTSAANERDNFTGGNEQTSTTTSEPITTTEDEPPIEEASMWDYLPEIGVTPESYFVYEYTSEYGGGIKITNYNGSSTDIRVPDTIDGSPIVCVNLDIETANFNDSLIADGPISTSLKLRVSELILPDTVRSFTVNVSNLNYVNIPSQIESFSLSGATALKAVYIDYGVTTIGENVFGGCRNLEKVYFSNSVTEISREAFYGCEGLKSIELPPSVKSLGAYAFGHCENLESVNILGRITYMGQDIGGGPFYSCKRIKSITYMEEEYSSLEEFNTAYEADKKISNLFPYLFWQVKSL